MPQQRITIPMIRSRKGAEPLVVLTAYTAPVAKALDAEVDILLVGDSLGMVLYGLSSTLPVSLEMMIAHGAAVVRSSEHACVVVDMPFGSYESSTEQAFLNAARMLKETGCQAVKIEGGEAVASTIARMTSHGIPVMGHIGLTPQHVHQLGGFKVQGGSDAARAQLLADMRAVVEAGVFALVLEGVYDTVADELVSACPVPIIGIGASAACDGQVLVTEDMVGMTSGYIPKFVKQYADVKTSLADAARAYAQDVRARTFPTDRELYHQKSA